MLRTLRRLTLEADRLLEGCVRDRLSLAALMGRFLPALEGWLGLKGALVTTRNEHLVEETFTFGEWTLLGGADLHAEDERRAVVVGSGTSMWMKLLRRGHRGRAARGAAAPAIGGPTRPRSRSSSTRPVAELDVVLSTVHTAAHKQRLVVEVEELLTDAVFDHGVDRAVRAIHREIRLVDFALLYHDEVERGRFRYRIYHGGELRHSSEGPRHAALDAGARDPRRRAARPRLEAPPRDARLAQRRSRSSSRRA